MKTITTQIAALLVVILLSTACGNKANQNDETTTSDSTAMGNDHTQAEGPAKEDIDFVNTAASGGMMEVELARMAQQKGSNSKVKQYGAMLEKDHTKANDELKAIAGTKGITIPAEMNEKHRDMVNMLKDKSGKEFDKHYIDMMVNDHEKDINAFKDQSEDGKDADLRNFASTTLPTLQMHLDSAKAIDKMLKK